MAWASAIVVCFEVLLWRAALGAHVHASDESLALGLPDPSEPPEAGIPSPSEEPQSLASMGCYEAYTANWHCAGYENCGYTCTRGWCVVDRCVCSCSACSQFFPDRVPNYLTGRCEAQTRLAPRTQATSPFSAYYVLQTVVSVNPFTGFPSSFDPSNSQFSPNKPANFYQDRELFTPWNPLNPFHQYFSDSDMYLLYQMRKGSDPQSYQASNNRFLGAMSPAQQQFYHTYAVSDLQIKDSASSETSSPQFSAWAPSVVADNLEIGTMPPSEPKVPIVVIKTKTKKVKNSIPDPSAAFNEQSGTLASCKGICGKQHPDGCYCDSGCRQSKYGFLFMSANTLT